MVVEAEGKQLGIVERRVDPGLERRLATPFALAQRRVLAAQALEFGSLAGTLGGIVQRPGIECFEARTTGQDQRGELLAALLLAAVRRRQSTILAPLAGTFLFDEGGEGFVEGGVVAQVELLVRQFVEDQGRQPFVVPAQHAAEDRIVEPAEGRVGLHPADVDVVAERPLARRLGARGGLAVVAAVGHAAGDGEAMGDRLQRQLRVANTFHTT